MARRVLHLHGRRGDDPRDAVARAVHADGDPAPAVDAVQRGGVPANGVHRDARALHHARTVQAADARAARRAVGGGARRAGGQVPARARRPERPRPDGLENQRGRVAGDGGGVGHWRRPRGRSSPRKRARPDLAREPLRPASVAGTARRDGAALAAGRRRVHPLAEQDQTAQPRTALPALRFLDQAAGGEGDARRGQDLLPAQHRLPRARVHHARAPQPPGFGHLPRRAGLCRRPSTRRRRFGLVIHTSREPLRGGRGQAAHGREASVDRGPRTPVRAVGTGPAGPRRGFLARRRGPVAVPGVLLRD